MFDGRRNDRYIAVIDHIQLFEGRDVQGGIVSPDQQRRLPDLAWAETRSCAIGCATVERHAEDRYIHIFQISCDRQAHEGWNTNERLLSGAEGGIVIHGFLQILKDLPQSPQSI